MTYIKSDCTLHKNIVVLWLYIFLRNDLEAQVGRITNRHEDEKRSMHTRYQSIIGELDDELDGAKVDTRAMQVKNCFALHFVVTIILTYTAKSPTF